MDSFVTKHRVQLDFLNIPDVFFPSIKDQFDRSIIEESDGVLKQESLLSGGKVNLTGLESGDIGSMVVIPHLCSWDMLDESNNGLWKALSELSVGTLQEVYQSLKRLWSETPEDGIEDDKDKLLEQICDPRTWSRVILYKRGDRVRGALPAPPFLLQVELSSEMDTTEADLSGPFPFQYHAASGSVVDCSLAYLNPNKNFGAALLPTMDYVPSYSVPNTATRSIRYAALLGDSEAPAFAVKTAKEMHANFVHQMHLVRQKQLEEATQQSAEEEGSTHQATDSTNAQVPTEAGNKIWKVYTDCNDPLELANAEHGLSKEYFELVSDPTEADILYSYSSLFAPGSQLNDVWKNRDNVLINQFPYEGAFVQKDHLGRELLKQYGLPRPVWAVETYDLDVQLALFVGAALLEQERTGVLPLWIIKPANGTQSQGHVVTRSVAQVLRLIDSGGGISRVAQRYIENPVCYKGRKLDCRCLVMMTSANKGKPTLYMYNRVYFRIAGKAHSVVTASDLMDHKSVLSAMHLVAGQDDEELLPIDLKTIAQLEADYGEIGFQWNALILPKLQTLVRELFTGMAQAYPAMGEKDRYRALYGVDTMFDIAENSAIEPKLTEVSFCPSNNAICDAYERDPDDFKNYNTDVFNCLFLGEVSDRITKIQ